MEMMLRPRSLICPLSDQALVIRPAFVGNGPAQALFRTSRCARSRLIRCPVASSDRPNRKSRRMVCPKIKVNAFRGYAQKVTIQSSTKKSEHHGCDEETIGTDNRQLSTDVVESTSGAGAEIAKEDPLHNASRYPIFREIEEVGLDFFEAELPGNALINISLGELEVVDEAEVEEDKFEVDFSGIALSSAAVWELDSEDEANTKEDIFVVDLSRIASDSAVVGEVVDEIEAIHETFNVESSGNASSSGIYGYVDEVGEPRADQEVTFEMDVSRLGELNVVDHAKVGTNIFEIDFLSSSSGKAIYIAAESSEENLAKGENGQGQCPALPSTSMDDSAIDSPENSKSLQEQHNLVFDIDKESTIDSCVEDQPVVDYHKQGGNVAYFDKQKQLTYEFHEQDLSIVQFPEQNQAIFCFQKQDISFLEQKQAIVGSYKQDQSIVNSHEQDRSVDGSHCQDESIVGMHEPIRCIVDCNKSDQSIVGSYRRDKSIVGAPKKIQSIVGYYKSDESNVVSHKQDGSITGVPIQIQSIIAYSTSDQSIVDLPKQHQSIVHIPEQKQSIVGFHIQDLPIVGNSKDSQTKQHAIVRTHDALFTEEENFEMIEEQKSIRVDEEQWIATKERISMNEAEFLLLLSKKESSWAEEQCKVDETSLFAEQDILDLPHDNVDPQALQRTLQELAQKNYSLGSKLFAFPEVLKADSTIDLYFNRDLSTLANEPDILIKGAFNGWKWRFFTEKLHMSELGGDWWCCKLYIPKQAYRLDFVFFNGCTVYENNGNNDFMIQIESTMDEHLFEGFLVEEKKRELERLAIEEAERMRQAEEQRRKAEERAEDEADMAQSKVEVEMKKNKLHNVLGLARPSIDNLWYIEPVLTGQGAAVRLYYNRNSRPLVHSTEIWMHGGYNNWIDGLSFSERLVHVDYKDGDWWYADVVLPERIYVLDWVFADGPPGNARNYDNNARQDFHAILLNNMTEEEYWVEEEQWIYTRLQQDRREREETFKRKAERSAKLKAEMKKKTMKMFLVSQKHIVYTEPLEIHAGTTVDVLYNPSNTVLTGKPEVWFQCSFNRWMHPGGVLPPQKMVTVGNGAHLKATVNVPRDAYMMDFVFSELEGDGIYDNRNGLDYHIPVFGSVAKEPPMHIVHIAVEMAPIAKVGGLADVVTSLSRAVQDLGHNVEVILPKHGCLNLSNVKNLHVHQSFSFGGSEIEVWRGLVEDLCVYFLEPKNGIFGVGCVYGRNDDRRFGFFCHSALEFLLQSGSSPHILHCHDWSSAPVAWLYKENYAQSSLANARVVFTIHNLEFGAHYIGKAMRYCDKATTVSNSYSREVSGHGAITPHLGKFYGILNGIDPDIWDPYNDKFIPVHYTSENVVEGKIAAKKALQKKLGLQENDVPIVGIVTRLTAQKGIHLIKHAVHRTLEWNGQVVLLGSAPDPRIQGDFVNFANALHGVNNGRVRLCLTYDEPLSHLIYAGSDFILVPSMFEPCGLTQLVAMRYGAIPIVRKTGGLYDTVFDVDTDKERARARGLEPNGFNFDGADSRGVDYALNRAISAWFDARWWFHSLCKRVMEQDWSWNRSALDYIELYHSASKF
ncbi:starch synthase 3, chloroplastic/amyloplastic-like isoform X1 [Panicum virgatum]|uniref:starch synthase 3, chloroplastic/amyloplastic-like isoform X1 n=1 Tax=Panicum virgatum TaxID=38727 RepID=UPI0019D60136|nr:starch synthase 3, chloroplastic/amyloplastic-like isoform X1 [Panicum virgatum]XP_039814944.1 starch synthase 3, chloroplastic/amyloplastic-like isoform X1 [Panicum virgatum]XP_039814945.1 starch synthase 3, chloroplastic/amyloplastic-like isoform X1 [Panicum virgatum]